MQYLTQAAMLTTPSNLPSLAQMSEEVKGETKKNRETEGDKGRGGAKQGARAYVTLLANNLEPA